MKKFKIIPHSLTFTDVNAKTADDAVITFAETMDSDMNAYVKAVSEEKATDEVVNFIVKAIDGNKLDGFDCLEIFRALQRQNEVIGGKIWITDDICKSISENFGDEEVHVTKEWKKIVADTISRRYSALDEMLDEEWNTIKNAVENSDLKVHVHDIVWDLDPEEFTDEAEMQAVKENMLPESVDIPLADLEYNKSIADWLSENYDYCVEAYCITVEDDKRMENAEEYVNV